MPDSSKEGAAIVLLSMRGDFVWQSTRTKLSQDI